MGAAASHCNERKESAKNASEKSGALYLYTMLYNTPCVFMATVMAVNGNRFFDVYVPALGIEQRLQVPDARPALKGFWEAASRCVHTVYGAFHVLRTTVRTLSLRLDPNKRPKSCLTGIANRERLRNEEGLAPRKLPLTVTVMQQLPVVVSATRNGVSGSFEDALVRLFLDDSATESSSGQA